MSAYKRALKRGGVQVFCGDCLDVLADTPEESIDAVVTDPPYGLEFMGKAWDRFEGNSFQAWCTTWSAECLRVLKPGGHMLVFGGTRTGHRLTCAVEDAGFEIRDSIAWLYGSGFPKSHDVSKAIDKAAGATREVISVGKPVKRMIPGADQNLTGSWIKDNGREFVPTETTPSTNAAKQWAGWGTALKPGYEPIIVARKPLHGTVAANVVKHGTGAINIDACRVEANDLAELQKNWDRSAPAGFRNGEHTLYGKGEQTEGFGENKPTGRWPTNVVLDEHQAAELDGQTEGVLHGAGHARDGSEAIVAESYAASSYQVGHNRKVGRFGDTGGASRFFPVFKYQAKAPAKERPKIDGIAHPTVKPLELMRWLVTLVTPPDGIVLDPFAGSGTTLEAAILNGFRCIGIESEPDYIPLISARVERAQRRMR